MAKKIPDIDEQWRLWQIENEPERFKHIDTDNLKTELIDDLTIKSKMDVREYTLYQKWLEVHEKYPTRELTTLFGQEVQLVNPDQIKLVNEVKSKFFDVLFEITTRPGPPTLVGIIVPLKLSVLPAPSYVPPISVVGVARSIASNSNSCLK
jgi:hypothetical protein